MGKIFMNLKNEAKQIINTLDSGKFYVDCPCCGEPILLRNAGLFYLDDFTPEAEELYRKKIDELKEQEKELRERRRNIPLSSEMKSTAVNIGFILERIAPSMKEFTHDRNDCRSLFDPIDYVIFEGLNKRGIVTKILFVDIKTGKAKLTGRQKEISKLVENKKVLWDTYDPEEEI